MKEKPHILVVSATSKLSQAGGLNSMTNAINHALEKNFKVTSLYLRDKNFFVRQREFLNFILKSRNRKLNTVYFHSIFYLEFISFTFFCILFGVRYQIHSHGSLSRFAFGEKSIKKNLVRPLLIFCIRRAEHIVYSSHKEAQKSYFLGQRYLCLKNFIKLDDSLKDNTAQRTKSKLIYISKIDWKYKGISEMISAFEDFSEENHSFELHIYGYGTIKTPQYQIDLSDQAIHNLLDRIKNTSNIKYHGAIYAEEKWSILKKSGALCLFSKSEAMPLILSEAISVGTVVLFSEATNYTSIIQDEQFVCDGSHAGIVRLLNHYASNITENYEVTSQDLQVTFNREFSSEIIEDELHKLSCELLQNS